MGKGKLPQRWVSGFRLEIILNDGEQRFTNITASNEYFLRKKVRCLGGKGYDGIKTVLSFEPHEWQEEYYQWS